MKTLGRTSVLSSPKRLLQMAPVNPFNFPETLWHLQGARWPATGQRIYVRSNDWNMRERCSLVHIGDWHAHEISTIWGSAKRLEICFLVRNIFIKMMANHAHAVDGTSFSCPSWCWTCQWHQHGTTSSEPWSWQLAPSSVCQQQRAHHPCTQWNLGAECRHTWRAEFRQVLDGNDAVGTTPHHLPDTPIGVYTFLILSEYWLTPAPNVRKVANRCVFSMIRGSWCSKSRLAKAVGAEVAVQQRHEKWHAAVARRAFCRSKCTKHLSAGPILDVTMSKNGTPLKRISKSKFTTHHMVGPILEVSIAKNGTPLWRKAHLQVKMRKTPHDRTNFWSSDSEKWHPAVARSSFASQNVKKLTGWATFQRSDFQKWHAVVARSAFASQNLQNTWVLGHFWSSVSWLVS